MDLFSFIISRMNYFTFIILMTLGMYGIFSKQNLLKKIIGLNILQTAIILFFISTSAKQDATLPILEHPADPDMARAALDAVHYVNPLPHVLMLTAIVVAVATLGVALAMVIKIHRDFGTIEEDQILLEMEKSPVSETG